MRLIPLLCLVYARALLAQDSSIRQPSEFALRSAGTISFVQSRAQGAFADNVHFGYGGSAAYLFRLDHAGAVALRAEVGYLQYGHESKQVPLSSTIGGRIQVDLSTTNAFVPFWIGPQFQVPRGTVRPYVNAGVGGQVYFTQSQVRGTSNDEPFASTTNQSDFTGAWVAGGGLYIPVRSPTGLGHGPAVAIDLGAQYINGGRAQYLKPGSIQDLPDGETIITPIESDTHMVVVRLGVRIGG